jgi:hypothetical protein
MSTNNRKYLVLRGKNKDIYFIQKRVSKKISSIIGKDFIKKSLETSDIDVAIAKRDQILRELDDIEANSTHENQNISNLINESSASTENNLNIKQNNELTRDASDSGDGILEKYLDMEVIRSIKPPSMHDLVLIFDKYLGLIILFGVMAAFFALN